MDLVLEIMNNLLRLEVTKMTKAMKILRDIHEPFDNHLGMLSAIRAFVRRLVYKWSEGANEVR